MASLAAFGLDVGIYGATAEPETILRLARHAEEAGFDSIWLADHVVFPVSYASRYPYSAGGAFPAQLSEPLMEPIATMGVLVGATRRVRIGTAVLVMPYRNPLLLARMLVTLDRFQKEQVIASVLLFRLLYYIVPFGLALVALGTRELWMTLANRNKATGKRAPDGKALDKKVPDKQVPDKKVPDNAGAGAGGSVQHHFQKVHCEK